MLAFLLLEHPCKNISKIVSDGPIRIVLLELRYVADVTNVVADAIRFAVRMPHSVGRHFLDQLNTL